MSSIHPENISISELWHTVRHLEALVSRQLGDTIETDGLKREIQLRRQRDKLFPLGYFADVAWEILLDLYEAHRNSSRMCVTSLGLGGGVPLTTTLRYLDRLIADGLIQRTPDPLDRRRIFIELTDVCLNKMDHLFGGASRQTTNLSNVVEMPDRRLIG